ncbi:hypothetical protein [Nitrospirillum amazonense]|uniref:hypothetical protein n=1 Tax=Nitrospirillum amazonense TaxID=28077 RepID=UPI0024129229|nr:hypothetical protein [Nitrospirillum amazonense]MDG3442467.1 hypothetical protein [Nitrospirillum amazonense]
MSDFIEISSEGLPQVIVRVQQFPDAVRLSIQRRVYGEAVRLQNVLKNDALNGGIVKARTKRLRNSVHIDTEVAGDRVITYVGTDVEYAKYLEEGTAAHEIRAKHAKALAFMVGGDLIFRKKVQHPGTPAFRPFGLTFERETPGILKRLEEGVRADAQAVFQ